MDNLIELSVAVIFGGLGVLLFRLFGPKTASKQNEVVIKQVNELDKKNQQLEEEIKANNQQTKDELDALEKEKKRTLTKKELEDFFNVRKK